MIEEEIIKVLRNVSYLVNKEINKKVEDRNENLSFAVFMPYVSDHTYGLNFIVARNSTESMITVKFYISFNLEKVYSETVKVTSLEDVVTLIELKKKEIVNIVEKLRLSDETI